MKPLLLTFIITVAALSAFTLPSSRLGVQEVVQTVFVPVSAPVHAVGSMLTNRLSPVVNKDPRGIDELRRQNAMLQTQLGILEAQVDELRRYKSDFSHLDLRLQDHVQPAAVFGTTSNGRQTLNIFTHGLTQIKPQFVVVHPGGLVGQVYAVATGGGTARVLLATDPDSHITARIVRIGTDDNGNPTRQVIPVPTPMVDGNGKTMIIRALPAREVRQNILVGDIVELADNHWPNLVQGLRIGTVSKITLPATNAEYAPVEVTPTADLTSLPEVLVLDK